MRSFFLLLPALVAFGCSRPDSSAPAAAVAPQTICTVADMGTADPALTQLATSRLAADPARQDAWALSSLVTGSLVVSKETIDLWQSPAAAAVTDVKTQFGQTTTRTGAPSADALSAFDTAVAGADHLCDVSVAAFGGVTHHYVHVERQADGSLTTRGAFVARNPELSAADAAQTDLVKAFQAVVAGTL